MYLIKSRYNIPYKTIGTLFGDRDHSTVLAACEKIDNDIKHSYFCALDYTDNEEVKEISEIIKDGLAMFENIFGFKSKSFKSPLIIFKLG